MKTKMVLALASLVLGACGSSGGSSAPADPNRLKTSCDGFGASDDRSALAYLDGKQLVVRTAQGTRSMKRPACMKSVDTLFVAPGGVAVAAYGSRHSMSGDLWGHSGKVTTAECVVELGVAGERKLDDDRAFTWVGTEAVPLAREKLPSPPERCRVFSTKAGPVAWCIDWVSGQPQLTARRFAGRELEVVGEDLKLMVNEVVGGGFDVDSAVISPDGRRLALWGTRLAIFDLESGKPVMELAPEVVGRVGAVEFDPSGRDRVMLIGVPYDGSQEPTLSVRVLGFDGARLYTGSETGADRVLYWTEPGAYWSTHFCGAERIALPL